MLAEDGRFDGNFLTGWLSPMSVFSGFFVVVMCTYLAAVFLARSERFGRCRVDPNLATESARDGNLDGIVVAGRRGVRR